MSIDKPLKKLVIEDWQEAFPQLTFFSQEKFYTIIGSIITGIELIRLPRTEEYRPLFVIYPLWKSDIKTCLGSPIVLKEFNNKKGLQFSIPFEKHSVYFGEVSETVKKQTPLSFKEDVPLKKVFDIIDQYSKESPLSAAPNSYLQAKLQEAKLEIALYISNNEAQNVYAQINKRKWDVGHFKMWNVEINKWLKDLQEKVDNREEILNQITINKRDKKIEKLKRLEILPV